mmetsp:Transcript_59900/g.126796  ORF Transcript_59900/g.126796 Transcript_59900/m.126796 type:complete len:398 (-) Transcript_59900:68-1261(-)
MKSFDAFGRPVQEFQVKTVFGGSLFVGSLVVLVGLFLMELWHFTQKETKDKMVIDQGQEQKYFNLTLDITFPEVPCSVLAMNLMDSKKANLLHVSSEIFKTRLDAKGTAFGKKVRDSLTDFCTNNQDLQESGMGYAPESRSTHATTGLRCPSCYQSHIDEDDCCLSCDDVRREFKAKGLDPNTKDYTFSQCESEAYQGHPPKAREGCRVEAKLHVRKIPATLHIGVARNFEPTRFSEDWSDRILGVNFRHRVDSLSFGPDFPGLVRVLDGREKSEHSTSGSEHYQYNVHVIPTRFAEDGYDEITSHQYSVTEYMKEVFTRETTWEVPPVGVAMTYDFTPFEVQVTKSRKSFWHFLTQCCAILGGIFAFSGMLDNFAYQFNKSGLASAGIEMYSRSAA